MARPQSVTAKTLSDSMTKCERLLQHTKTRVGNAKALTKGALVFITDMGHRAHALVDNNAVLFASSGKLASDELDVENRRVGSPEVLLREELDLLDVEGERAGTALRQHLAKLSELEHALTQHVEKLRLRRAPLTTRMPKRFTIAESAGKISASDDRFLKLLQSDLIKATTTSEAAAFECGAALDAVEVHRTLCERAKMLMKSKSQGYYKLCAAQDSYYLSRLSNAQRSSLSERWEQSQQHRSLQGHSLAGSSPRLRSVSLPLGESERRSTSSATVLNVDKKSSVLHSHGVIATSPSRVNFEATTSSGQLATAAYNPQAGAVHGEEVEHSPRRRLHGILAKTPSSDCSRSKQDTPAAYSRSGFDDHFQYTR